MIDSGSEQDRRVFILPLFVLRGDSTYILVSLVDYIAISLYCYIKDKDNTPEEEYDILVEQQIQA